MKQLTARQVAYREIRICNVISYLSTTLHRITGCNDPAHLARTVEELPQTHWEWAIRRAGVKDNTYEADIDLREMVEERLRQNAKAAAA